MFIEQISQNMETYTNNIIVESKKAEDHTKDLSEVFRVLMKYKVKLNQQKCVFRVLAKKFIGFIVS